MFDFKYKWYRLKWLLAPKFHIVTEFPTCINIEPTSACNLKCIMCCNNSHKMKKGFMDINLYKKIIDECQKYKLYSIKLSWRGEPLLHKNLIDMIKYAKDSGIHEIIINTNGLLLNINKIKELVDSGIDSILISIDGADKKTYEEIRKGGNFDVLDGNIKNLIRIRNKKGVKLPKVKLHAIRMQENNNSIDLLYDKYADIVDDIHISDEIPLFNIERSKNYKKETKKIIRKPCDQLWQRLAISWNGDVAMCCNDWIPKIVLGNVKTESIYDIWHGGKLNYIRNLHKQLSFNDLDVCSSCVCQDSQK